MLSKKIKKFHCRRAGKHWIHYGAAAILYEDTWSNFLCGKGGERGGEVAYIGRDRDNISCTVE